MLKKYVLKKEDRDVKQLNKVAKEWVKASFENKLTYEIEWLGMPIIQTTEDMILMQELIFKVKPDVIIEIGIGHGGSLVYYASLLELIGKGFVIGIDIDIRPHNRKALMKHKLYSRMGLIEGDSTSPTVIKQLSKYLFKKDKILVCLDSNHTKDHVLKELECYSPLVTKGSYIVVFDTIISQLVKQKVCDKKYLNNSPKDAVKEFLKHTNKFIIDKECNKLFISYNPDGYLKRVK